MLLHEQTFIWYVRVVDYHRDYSVSRAVSVGHHGLETQFDRNLALLWQFRRTLDLPHLTKTDEFGVLRTHSERANFEDPSYEFGVGSRS